jgi:ubiquinone/menaquinone biosynthesis C-methylase UbiE
MQSPDVKDALPCADSYAVARRYWANVPVDGGDSFGAPPLGGSGQAEIYYRHHEELRTLRRLVDFSREKSILELGCGAGRWAVSLSPLVRSYTGIDFSSRMLEIARQRVSELHICNVKFEHASLLEFNPSEAYDLIYLSSVSQYLFDTDLVAILKRLSAAVSPTGVLIDRSTTHRFERSIRHDDTYFSIYRTIGEIEQIFRQGGFVVYVNKPSYRDLALPYRVRRWTSTQRFADIVRRTEPFSYDCLRLLAWTAKHLCHCQGEMAEFSHDFSLFRRSA